MRLRARAQARFHAFPQLRDQEPPAYLRKGKSLVHRMVWEQHFGPIPEGHIIHHRNGDTWDNRIENLECLTRHEHTLRHKGRNRADEDLQRRMVEEHQRQKQAQGQQRPKTRSRQRVFCVYGVRSPHRTKPSVSPLFPPFSG